MKVIKLQKRTIKKLESMLVDLKKGIPADCPQWTYKPATLNNTTEWNCEMCKKLFPRTKAKSSSCPCEEYKASYLIKRLTEIIKFNKEGEK